MSLTAQMLFCGSLNADIFRVSVCVGTMTSRPKNILRVGSLIAGIQNLEPVAGFVLGHAIGTMLRGFGHLVGSGIIIVVGLYYFRESRSEPEATGVAADLVGLPGCGRG